MDDLPIGLITGAGLVVPSIIGLVFYVYIGYALMVIAQKLNIESGWWGFVPILNILLMIKIAEKPMWWIVLLLIPLVNVVVGIILWMKIAERRGKPSWVGILMIVPIVQIVIPGYLAFTD